MYGDFSRYFVHSYYILLMLSEAHNESSMVRRQEQDTPTHLIKIPNLHMMDVLLKIDWMMADAVRTRYRRQFSIGWNWAVRGS